MYGRSSVVPCANKARGCPCDSFDQRPQTYCCSSCADGLLCRTRLHTYHQPTTSMSALPGNPLPAARPITPSTWDRPSTLDRDYTTNSFKARPSQTSLSRPSYTLDTYSRAPLRSGATTHVPAQPMRALPSYTHSPVSHHPTTAIHQPTTMNTTRRAANCARLGCPCDAYDGSPGSYCCMTCRNGTRCVERFHVAQSPVTGTSLGASTRGRTSSQPPPARTTPTHQSWGQPQTRMQPQTWTQQQQWPQSSKPERLCEFCLRMPATDGVLCRACSVKFE